MTRTLAIVALLSGCASFDAAMEASGGYATDTALGVESQLRVDVFPANALSADGSVRALPQTLGPFAGAGTDIDLGRLALTPPGTFSGVVSGDLTTPWADGAQLPSEPGPVAADVTIVRDQSVQRYTLRTDELGEFSSRVVPTSEQERYRITIVPDDPLIPFTSRDIGFRTTDEFESFDLGYGVALYGRVVNALDEPVSGVRVHAVDAAGVSGAVAHTDASGWYLLRVAPGDYQVVSAGRDHGRDPTLTSPLVTAEPEIGTQVDFQYPELVGAFAVGRVLDPTGAPVPDVTVRFTATALEAYGDLATQGFASSLVLEDVTDANGNFEASLIPGTYRIEYLPPATDDPTLDHAPVLATDQRSGGGGLTIGSVTLPTLLPTEGFARDINGVDLVGARVTCTELGFGGRSWSTFTADNGRWDLSLPPIPVDCVVQPPGERVVDLAWTREQIDPSISDGHVFEVRAGTNVRGAVDLDDVPEGFALVEIRNGLDELLGATLTDQDGLFSLRLDLPEDDGGTTGG